MNTKRLDQRLRKKVTLLSTIVPVAVFAFAICTSTAAQTAPATPPPASQLSQVKFKPPTLPTLTAGKPTAFSLCSGAAIPIPDGKFTDTIGQSLDTKQMPCQQSSFVNGGNGPYSFQLGSGFPPLGMHLGLNGVLYGTPYPPPLGGYPAFNVCAVDIGTRSDCHEMKFSLPDTTGKNGTPDAADPAKVHSNKLLVMSLLGLGGVAAVVGAHEMSNAGSGTEAGTCDGQSPVNACGACSCTDNGTCNNPSSTCGGSVCYWAGPGTAPGQAPFCANGVPD